MSILQKFPNHLLVIYNLLLIPVFLVMYFHLQVGSIPMIGYLGIWLTFIGIRYESPLLATSSVAFTCGILWYLTAIIPAYLISIFQFQEFGEITAAINELSPLELTLRFCIATVIASIPLHWMINYSVFDYPILPGLYLAYLVFFIFSLLPVPDELTGRWVLLLTKGDQAFIPMLTLLAWPITLLSLFHWPLGAGTVALIRDAVYQSVDNIAQLDSVLKSIAKLQNGKDFPINEEKIAKGAGCPINQTERILVRLIHEGTIYESLAHGYLCDPKNFPKDLFIR